MAVASTSASKMEEGKQTTGNGGIRVVGRRIFDSESGQTCHQCRQKIKGFLAPCKKLKKNKQCPIKYCCKCLLNRYGENAEEVALLVDWNCPKCRDNCNCSLCMKKKGHKPTGILVHTAKATGYSSVSELLQAKGPESFGYEKIGKDISVSPKKQVASKKECMAASPRKLGKENSFDGDSDSKVDSQNLTSFSNENKSKKMKREGLKELYYGNEDHEASLKKNSPKKPKVLNEASKKKVKGNGKDSGCVSDKNNSKTGVQMDDPSCPSKGDETKCAKSKKAGVLNGVKIPGEISKKREPTISDEESREKLKLKEKFKGDFMEEKNSKMQVLESNTISPVGNKKNGVKSEDPGGLIGFENDNTSAELKSDTEPRKNKKCTTQVLDKNFDMDIQLPQGTSLITVAGVDLPPQDVGHALQFLEFCAAFGLVFDMKKGQAESVIREIIRGRGRCRLQYSPLAQLHTQLLSLIQKDMGKKFPSLRTSDHTSWFRALGQCVSESQCALEEVPSNFFDKGVDAYNMLDSSTKLKLLNFLCDEALCTITLRSWIDKQNLEFVDSEKEAKEKILAARDKEKQLRQKMQDEVAKVITGRSGAPVSVSEHETLVAQMKREAAQAHADVLQAMGMLPKKRQRSDAVRTAPIVLDVNGHAFWRLRGYTSEPYILLQDIGTLDPVAPDEKWFAYDVKQKAHVEKYISSIRTKRLRIQKLSDSLPIASVETNS
ncbi:Zinc-finger domain of monoamine-oxidase A repressor R1 protein, putative isoform 3 [Theobroma cacao]|uniref:Zinc-finger domain of monoamine-oxidase A repressor R1 protein, putative isoform 3 n=2 Tax=Theobroma cacao TaxID=3641 RepID=A0A061EGX1_THECC|nr:Zinc-finger domain of monoamine-oxidase A repressor R1 protein, putative isoform 3 [Theobroma cacao]